SPAGSPDAGTPGIRTGPGCRGFPPLARDAPFGLGPRPWTRPDCRLPRSLAARSAARVPRALGLARLRQVTSQPAHREPNLPGERARRKASPSEDLRRRSEDRSTAGACEHTIVRQGGRRKDLVDNCKLIQLCNIRRPTSRSPILAPSTLSTS